MFGFYKLPVARFFHHCHFLQVALADGHHQSAAGLQLFQQGGGHFRGRGGDEDAVERAVGGQAPVAVAVEKMNLVAQGCQQFLGCEEQFLLPLDGQHPGPELGQHGRLVSAARADLQYPELRFHLQQLGLECHRIRLGDGLSRPDGKGLVAVRKLNETAVHEQVPRHGHDGRQHLFIGDTLFPEFLYQLITQALVLKTVFHAPLRVCVGFMNKIS
jgi:hypothetical protein